MAKLNIITPIYGQWQHTKSFIEDMVHLDEQHKIIIVDNGSIDNSYNKAIELITKIPHKCKFLVVHNETNQGFSRANNQAYKLIDEDSVGVLFLNNDVRVNVKNFNDWTAPIFEAIDKNKNTIFSPTAGLLDDNFCFVYETKNPNHKWNYLSGWCLFGSIEVFDKICFDLEGDEGPWHSFDEHHIAYFEDDYMSFQAKKLGIELKIFENLAVSHIGCQTGRKMNLPLMYNSARDKFIKEFKAKGFSL